MRLYSGIAVPEHAAGQCMDDIRSNTTFRPNPLTGTLLSDDDAGFEAPHRCVLERESDEKEVAMRIESTTFGAITIDGKTYGTTWSFAFPAKL